MTRTARASLRQSIVSSGLYFFATTTDDGSTDAAGCVQNDHPDGSPDCRPTFTDMGPFAPGEAYYYMVRGQNSCGTGSYGLDSGGMDRTVGAGDCP